jgi:hypothetical protein
MREPTGDRPLILSVCIDALGAEVGRDEYGTGSDRRKRSGSEHSIGTW